VTQSDAVNDLGVDLGQGWLYGRPAFPEARAAA
jgi:EAL domain-containing protein (putative c-di-GMP-specific phosphodiesterase class I)